MLDFTLTQHARGGTLTASADGQRVGEITFAAAGEGVIDLDHTEVDPVHEGKGYGRQLVRTAADHARAEGLKLNASCPFARKVLERDSSVLDLLTWTPG